MINLINKKHTAEDIVQRRSDISKRFIKASHNIQSGVITAILSADLVLMFVLYDQLFFDNWFKDSYKGKMKFSLSRRMTKSAGSTICPKNIAELKPEKVVLEIRIGVDFFFQYGMVEGPKPVCGVNTNNSLEALQLVFEHELCHIIEYICFGASNCRGGRFKTIANNLFAHTASHHNLPTYQQIANQKFALNIGDTVLFTFKGKQLKGVIVNITKRATIMVKDKNGLFVDKQGIRYTKYYVPLNLLEPANHREGS